MVVILILCVSLVIGGLWGFRQVRSHRFSFAVFLTAPVASAAFFFVVVTMMMMLDPSPAVLARPLFDRIIGYVLTGFLYGGWTGGLFGAIPALVGSGGTQLLILWARARCAAKQVGSAVRTIE